MLDTATITGIFHGTDGAAVTDADVWIVPRQTYVAAVDGAAWVPRSLTARTDATGALGTLDGQTFTAGVQLPPGQHDISVRKNDVSHNGLLSIDGAMITAGSAALEDALQPPAGTVGTIKGDAGWSPVLAVISDGSRRVLQVTGWTGGDGIAFSIDGSSRFYAGGGGGATTVVGEAGGAGGSGVFMVRYRGA